MGGGASLPAESYTACLGGISSRPYLSAQEAGGVASSGPVEDAPVRVLRVIDDGRQYLDVHDAVESSGSFELSHPEELVRFLREAKVALVRGKYLSRLVEQKRTLPRRQEAELEDDAFVTDAELGEWITKERPVIWSISHCWESREYADPYGYQIHRLKEGFEKTKALGLEMFESSWFFYDYVCLYQFKREEAHEEESFRKAMGNMHVLYAHECTRTISIQKATPPDWIDPEKSIPVYFLESGRVELRPVKSLQANLTPYIHRGWTQAELLWSSSRSRMLHVAERNLRISGCTNDAELLDGEATAQRAEVPVTPEIFRKRAEELQFTHRVDLDAVLFLQAKVFHYKAAEAPSLSLMHLSADDMETLSAALPHYKRLQSLTVSRFDLGSAAKSLEKALLDIPWLHTIRLTDCWEPCPELAVTMAAVLKGRPLRHLDLTGCRLTAAGCDTLAEALKDDRVGLEDLVLMDLKDSGNCESLAKALQSNKSVRTLHLYGTLLSVEALQHFCRAPLKTLSFGAQYHQPSDAMPWVLKDLGHPLGVAIADGLAENENLLNLDLSFTGLEDSHAKLLAKALKNNRTLRTLDLRSDKQFSEETRRELQEAWGRPSEHLQL